MKVETRMKTGEIETKPRLDVSIAAFWGTMPLNVENQSVKENKNKKLI